MEIILKNTTDEFQKCTLFGQYDRALKLKRDENDFFSFTTGEGVEIYFNGKLNELSRFNFLKSLENDRFCYSRLEYTDSTNETINIFHLYLKDANGKSDIIPIIPMSYVKPTDESIFPIKIEGEDFKYITFLTSFLFLLRPKQTITLNFVKSDK